MNAVRRAVVVVDLGFGDAGKGLVTDALVRRTGAHTVVRFNGGAQAGHNVVTDDGRHHTFAQLGAGTFVPGVRTVLGADFVVHPGALGAEARRLEAVGVSDPRARLSIARAAPVITPFHQATGRLRELARGGARHGSCGIGFGETVADVRAARDDVVRVADLAEETGCLRLLARVRERKRAELVPLLAGVAEDPAARAELAYFEDDGVARAFLDQARAALAGVAVDDEAILARHLARAAGTIVFEGAQGVLIDEDFGFHPHTTWSHCTFAGALDLLARGSFDGATTRLGLTRAYAVRHGAGPFPTEDVALDAIPELHNAAHPWQGRFRRGALDLVLLRYAIAAVGGVDGVLVTHLDAARARLLSVCEAYDFADASGTVETVTQLGLPPAHLEGDARLAWQEALGVRVGRARPRLRLLTHADRASTWRDVVTHDLGVAFAGASDGPTASHVGFAPWLVA